MFSRNSIATVGFISSLFLSCGAGAESEWRSSYNGDSLVETNPDLKVALAVSHFPYKNPKKEISHLGRIFNCSDIEIEEDKFLVKSCLLEDGSRQDIIGRLIKKQDDREIYLQVYAIGEDAGRKETYAEMERLLAEDPISNPRNEWLSNTDQLQDASTQIFENRKLGASISLSASAYLGSKADNIKSLSKLFLCNKVEATDNGVNFSNCQSYRYYEIRDLEYPYYLISSVGVDFLNNKEVMDKYHELQKTALAQLAIQIEERKSSDNK